jgi:hypothetical protein
MRNPGRARLAVLLGGLLLCATAPTCAAFAPTAVTWAERAGTLAQVLSRTEVSVRQARPRSLRAVALRLSAAFSSRRLGHGTSVTVSFRLSYPSGVSPVPVSSIELLYPAGLGIGTSDLGLQTCDPVALAASGAAVCPENSLMGSGTALVQVPFGPREVSETAPIEIFSQPVQKGHIGLLFSVSGDFPVIAELAFGAFVLPAGGRYGGVIHTQLPPVPSVPGGPNVALIALRTTLGGRHIVYSERIGGRTLRFHPEGVLLPKHCPREGFPFAARIAFADGTRTSASTAVPCPRLSGRRPANGA